MAEANYVALGVDLAPWQDGLKKAAQGLQQSTHNMKADADRWSLSMRGVVAGLASAFAGLGAVSLGTQAIRAADDFASLQQRLQNTARDGASVSTLMDAITSSADRARAPIRDVAEAFFSGTAALKDYNFSQAEVIRLSETMAKLVKMAGASAENSGEKIRDLAHVISTQRFEETGFLRLKETFPQVFEILRAETGKSEIELRKLAERGRLTGSTIAQAILNSAETIDAKFGATTETSMNAWNRMVDAVSNASGEIVGKSSAITSALNAITEAARQSPSVWRDTTTALGNAWTALGKFIDRADNISTYDALVSLTRSFRADWKVQRPRSRLMPPRCKGLPRPGSKRSRRQGAASPHRSGTPRRPPKT